MAAWAAHSARPLPRPTPAVLSATTYTFPRKSGAYTLTASAPNSGSVTATERANALPPTRLASSLGARQTGAAGSTLPNPIVVTALDVYKNPVPGVAVTLSANGGAVVTPPSALTGADGRVTASLQLPTTVGTVNITAKSASLSVTCPEYSVAGQPASIAISGGNNQTAPRGTVLPQPLSVVVADQYGNPVPGVAVLFGNGSTGGIFANPNPETTDKAGTAAESYTLPPTPGVVTVEATVAGVSSSATFTETAQ